MCQPTNVPNALEATITTMVSASNAKINALSAPIAPIAKLASQNFILIMAIVAAVLNYVLSVISPLAPNAFMASICLTRSALPAISIAKIARIKMGVYSAMMAIISQQVLVSPAIRPVQPAQVKLYALHAQPLTTSSTPRASPAPTAANKPTAIAMVSAWPHPGPSNFRALQALTRALLVH